MLALAAAAGVVLLTSNCMTALSNPPTENTFFPSELNRTFKTCSACPLYSLHFVFSLGQGCRNNLTRRKSSPETNNVPSGERSTELTSVPTGKIGRVVIGRGMRGGAMIDRVSNRRDDVC